MNIPKTTAKITLQPKADILFIMAPFLSYKGCPCLHSGIRSTSNYTFIIQTAVSAVNEKPPSKSSNIVSQPDGAVHEGTGRRLPVEKQTFKQR